jgi:hypothetical protein
MVTAHRLFNNSISKLVSIPNYLSNLGVLVYFLQILLKGKARNIVESLTHGNRVRFGKIDPGFSLMVH